VRFTITTNDNRERELCIQIFVSRDCVLAYLAPFKDRPIQYLAIQSLVGPTETPRAAGFVDVVNTRQMDECMGSNSVLRKRDGFAERISN
jgi:hypothetical protein